MFDSVEKKNLNKAKKKAKSEYDKKRRAAMTSENHIKESESSRRYRSKSTVSTMRVNRQTSEYKKAKSEYNKKRRSLETLEQREKRLAKAREYKRLAKLAKLTG